MWLFTKEGFFSAVACPDDDDMLCVRTRRIGDLERLADNLGITIDIEENAGTDYQWRAAVDRVVLTEYMVGAIADIDYTGVKDSIDCGEADRHSALYRVWSAMVTLQDRQPFGLGLSGATWRVGGPTSWDTLDRDLTDPEDVIDVVDMGDGTFDVRLVKANDAGYVIVNNFDNRPAACELAIDLQDVIATWEGFVDVYDDDENNADYDDIFDDDDDDSPSEGVAGLAASLAAKLEKAQ